MADSRPDVTQRFFIVSVALFVGGIAFIIAGARGDRAGAAAPHEEPPPALVPVATIKQIMNGIVMPHANAVYSSVGTKMEGNKIEEIAPRNDREWSALADSGAAIVESGNLLLIGNRAIDQQEWVSITQRFIAAGKAVIAAAEQKSVDAVFGAGDELNATCDACHARYQRQ